MWNVSKITLARRLFIFVELWLLGLIYLVLVSEDVKEEWQKWHTPIDRKDNTNEPPMYLEGCTDPHKTSMKGKEIILSPLYTCQHHSF